jgi:molybdopterin synthase sulfur carrier subunit
LSVTIRLPGALLPLFPGCPRAIDVTAETIDEAMDALNARFPGMRDRLCDTRPAIRRHINMFYEGERATLRTKLAPGTEVLVMTAMSGG